MTHLPRLRERRNRTARVSIAVVAAVALLLGAGSAAQAAPPAPSEGSTGTVVTVTPPAPASSFTKLSAGGYHSLALSSSGRAWAWGDNFFGQLGDDSTTNRSTPVITIKTALHNYTAFTKIATGESHSIALDSTGRAWGWGRNLYGEVGNNATTQRLNAALVTMPTDVTFDQIAANGYFSLALDADGNAWAWGNNVTGQLGDGSTTNRKIPVAVTMPPGGVTFTQIEAGLYHALALGTDGKIYTWGNGSNGRLGNGDNSNRTTPGAVTMPPGGVTFTEIAAGYYHSLAIGTDGKTYTWGYGRDGRLGHDDTADRGIPTALTNPSDVTFTEISGGGGFSIARTSGGAAYAWGANLSGEVGDGTTTQRNTPVAVNMPADVTFVEIDAGGSHALARGSDGKTYAWGSGNAGRLGDGTTTDRRTPVVVGASAAAVTSVTFDGIAGTGLTNLGNGSWKVTAPAHALGPVNVVMNWTLGGIAQTPVTYVNGFTYTGPGFKITTRAFSDATRTTEIPKGSVLTPGSTIYWRYTVENTGAVPISIQDLKRDTTAVALPAACVVVELAVAATTSCTTQSTV